MIVKDEAFCDFSKSLKSRRMRMRMKTLGIVSSYWFEIYKGSIPFLKRVKILTSFLFILNPSVQIDFLAFSDLMAILWQMRCIVPKIFPSSFRMLVACEHIHKSSMNIHYIAFLSCKELFKKSELFFHHLYSYDNKKSTNQPFALTSRKSFTNHCFILS